MRGIYLLCQNFTIDADSVCPASCVFYSIYDIPQHVHFFFCTHLVANWKLLCDLKHSDQAAWVRSWNLRWFLAVSYVVPNTACLTCGRGPLAPFFLNSRTCDSASCTPPHMYSHCIINRYRPPRRLGIPEPLSQPFADPATEVNSVISVFFCVPKFLCQCRSRNGYWTNRLRSFSPLLWDFCLAV